VPELTLVISI